MLQLHAFAEMPGITLRLHTGKECDTSVVLLVYGPCMVVVVSGMTTSFPRAMIPQACMHNFMIPWRDGTSACSMHGKQLVEKNEFG